MSNLTLQTASPRPGAGKRSRALRYALPVALCAVLAAGCGVEMLAGAAIPQPPAPLSLLATPLAPASLPTTPPGFGLSGEATCRTTTPPTTSPWLTVSVQDAQREALDVDVFTW